MTLLGLPTSLIHFTQEIGCCDRKSSNIEGSAALLRSHHNALLLQNFSCLAERLCAKHAQEESKETSSNSRESSIKESNDE